MSTPRLIISFQKDSQQYAVVWVNIGKYEMWMNKKILYRELTMDQLIIKMALMIEEKSNEELPGANF